jgi:hypothetical protein
MNARILTLFGLTFALTARADDVPETSTKFDDLKPLIATLAKADKVVLHEGLPRPGDKSFNTEKTTKKTVTIANWLFYAEPLDFKDKDESKLTDLIGSEKTFAAFSGVKKCGGFHPDYALEWRVGKDTYYALICFGCHEVKVYGPGKGAYADIAKDGYNSLTALLKPYRKNRPERKGDD